MGWLRRQVIITSTAFLIVYVSRLTDHPHIKPSGSGHALQSSLAWNISLPKTQNSHKSMRPATSSAEMYCSFPPQIGQGSLGGVRVPDYKYYDSMRRSQAYLIE